MIFPGIEDRVAADVILVGVFAELAEMATGTRTPTTSALAVVAAAQAKALDLMSECWRPPQAVSAHVVDVAAA